jgi:hypothetical protein
VSGHTIGVLGEGSSGDATLSSTTLHNVFVPGAGTGGKTGPSRAMMAASEQSKGCLTQRRQARPSFEKKVLAFLCGFA